MTTEWHSYILLILLIFTALTRRINGQLSRCTVHRPDCSARAFHLQYRTHDGTCNNLHMTDWGASETPLLRLLPPEYEDDREIPIGYFDVRYGGYKKPNARSVSASVVGSEQTGDDVRHSAMLMHWGQFTAHDITHAKEVEDVNCTEQAQDRDSCFNIEAPPRDSRMHAGDHLPLRRSRACFAGGKRQQINSVTAYLDASNVYSSSKREAENLRGPGGLLRENVLYRSKTGLAFMPYDEATDKMDCFRNKTRSNIPCFLSGDARANEQQMLLILHTLFYREHNRIARELERINPEWTDETIYQETRKIVGAIQQHITLDDWLPKILGPVAAEVMHRFDDYRADVNPGVANAVSAAALRFGHTMVVPELKRMDIAYRELSPVRLRDAFFSPEIFVQLDDMDSLVRGAVGSPVKDIRGDSLVTNELTDHLFPNAHKIPLDLPALNIQRARDHALPPYNHYREMCGLPRITSWEQFADESRDSRTVSRLREQYGVPDNIDLWVGGMLERPLRGAKVGRTFSCLLADQYKRLRQGDRFWYENPGVFGRAQVDAIKRYSLSRVLCNNMDNAGWMPRDAFVYYPLTIRQFERCEHLDELDLTQWRIETDGYTGKYDCSSEECICVYQIGKWRTCDKGRQFRYDTLMTGRYPPCTEQRVVTRLCNGRRRQRGSSNNRSSNDAPTSFSFDAAHVVNHYNARQFNAARDIRSVMTRRQQFFEGLKGVNRKL